MSQAHDDLELAIMGAGYVGLVTAACLSSMGFGVRCIDRDESRVNSLRDGVMPFHEPGLEAAVLDSVKAGRLTFATSLSATHGAAAVFVAVGTLDARGDWSSRDVNAAVSDLAADQDAPRIFIVRSTMMPGATARLVHVAAELDDRTEIAINPEFTRQGTAVDDFLHPDRVVVGLTRPESESHALAVLRKVFEPLGAPLVVTNAASAEMIKTGSNVFLALKAGFANEVARLSAATGADVATVIDGIGMDKRIGRSYMTPGPGFGGSCLPSQVRSLPIAAHEHGVATPIMDAIDSSNGQQAGWVVDSLERAIGDLSGKRIAVLGLTFKAGTDDVRESPALRICRALVVRGATVAAHDPMGASAARDAADRDGFVIESASSGADATADASGIVVATEWPEYAALDWAQVAQRTTGRTVVDARAIVDVGAATAAGFDVIVHGRHAASTPAIQD